MQNSSGIKITYTARFLKSFKSLGAEKRQKLEACERLFRQNPFNPKLDTHKLHGRWEGYWAYSVDRHCRVIFVFTGPKMATYCAVGTHRIYGGE